MKLKHSGLLGLALSSFFLAGSVHAGDGTKSSKEAKAVVVDIFSQAGKSAVSKDPKLQNKINQQIDFDAMANATLGAAAKGRSARDRAWFRSTLQEIITRTVYPSAPDFLKSVKIKYKKVKLDGKNATVTSTVRSKGERTQVAYTLRQSTDGAWRVVDVAIDGESWVENIREQVRRTLRKRKWSGLQKRMNRRLASLRSGKSGAKTKKAEQAKRKRRAIPES